MRIESWGHNQTLPGELSFVDQRRNHVLGHAADGARGVGGAIRLHSFDRRRCHIVYDATATRNVAFLAVAQSAEIGFSPIAESTMLPIVRVVDAKVICRVVPLSTETRSSDHQKLEALRQLDQFRHWGSLEEKRYCLVCGKVIVGRQILVVDGTRGNGQLRLNCPTEGCSSIPMDWVLPTSEILAKLETLAAAESKASILRPVPTTEGNGKAVPIDAGHERFVSRLCRFAFHLKRHS